MTLQQLVEGVEQMFPTVGRTQILKEFDLAQKTLCTEAGLLEANGSLTDVSSYISWDLPSDFVSLDQVDYYDTDGYPLYSENLSFDYEVIEGKIHFYSITTTPLSVIPTSIIYIVLRYKKSPSDIDSISSTVDIDEVEYPAMEAFVLKRLFSKFKVPKFVDREGNVVNVFDTSALKYWDAEYHRLKVEAKRRNNLIDNTKRDSVFYNTTGQTYFVKRTKEVATTTVSIASYSSLYAKYVRVTATSPGTFVEDYKYGFGELTYEMDGTDIKITSTDSEFTTSMWADDIQNSAFAYSSTSIFKFTPSPTAWGTTVLELWIYSEDAV